MTTIIKARSKRVGGQHIHTTYFMGREGQTLANVGKLTTDIGQWQVFGAMLSLGAAHSNGHVEVINEGDEEICQSTETGI